MLAESKIMEPYSRIGSAWTELCFRDFRGFSNMFHLTITTVSARISKWQGTVSAKKGNLRRSTEKREKITKTYRISLLLGSIKCFPISFTHIRLIRWLPDGEGAGIIMTNKKN
jgi:hypothetical protein